MVFYNIGTLQITCWKANRIITEWSKISTWKPSDRSYDNSEAERIEISPIH